MAKNKTKHAPRWGLVLALCLADLWHEWLLTLCMVMAVAAVLGPLLILFGLKSGTVATLRERLIEDPRNREIRPVTSRSFTKEWFADISKQPGVAFVVPVTRQLAASVELRLAGGKGKSLSADAIPTAPGDPLVLENRMPVPEMGQALLSAASAEELKAGAGDTLTMTARRIKGGGFETGSTKLQVIGVLPLRAGATKAVFLPLPMLEAIETFKDGMAVPTFNWPGELPRAYPVFTALLVAVPEALNTELAFKLVSGTGFSGREAINASQAAKLLPATEAASLKNMTCYLLTTRGEPASRDNIMAVRNVLAGQQARLFTLVPEAKLTLSSGRGASAAFTALPASPFAASGPDKNDGPGPRPDLRLLLSPDAGFSGKVEAKATMNDNHLRFPAEAMPTPGMAPGTVALPPNLLGVLGLLKNRPLTWNAASRDFLLSKRGYAGFRLYASNLEQVAPLKRYLEEEQGIQVHTEAERIDDVLRLDAYLSLIFWLIAAGSLAGGAACLVANIYAGIERKRRDLAVLRLLGLSGGAFLRFPLYTAGFFAASGFAAALLLFFGMSFLINTLFAAHLRDGESICHLAWWHPLAALGLTMAVALGAGAVAALRSSKIDPAEALRNE